MKINFKLSALSASALFGGFMILQACSEEFLDKKPITDLTTSNFYSSKEDAITALTAAYDPLGWDVPTLSEWQMGDVVGGDTDKGSTDDQDYIQIRQMMLFTTTPDNSELNSRWDQMYQGIYRANVVLERVPEIPVAENDKARMDQVVGEAKYLRALYNFYLVKAFGRVPNITKVLLPTEVFVERPASIAENWTQIETDLTEAAAILPVSWSGGDRGRATKGAAQALLAKAYIFQSTPGSVYFTSPKWQAAADLTQTIIASGTYSLVPDYTSQFTLAGENNPELIFSMQATGGTGGWHNENEGQALNQWITPRTTDFSGWGFSTPIGPNTPEGYAGVANIKVNNIVEAYEPCDPRLKYNILGTDPNDELYGVKYNMQKDPDKPGQYKFAPWSRSNYNIRKFLIRESELSGAANSPLNVPIIRLADVLLWNAEANAELGNIPAALTSLNAVRDRARTSQTGATCPLPIATTSKEQLLNTIMDERRRELAFEGHRFFDLVRTNRAEAYLNAMGRPFKKGKNELFPIPQAEMNRNPKLVQNPGY